VTTKTGAARDAESEIAMGFLKDAKDRLIETVALPYLNRKVLEPYGKARELQLDTTANSAEIVLDLKGEVEPVRITIGRYEIFEQDRDIFVTLHAISTSREWATALAERELVGRPFKVPPAVAGVLTKIA
jgi:hypothetical protein